MARALIASFLGSMLAIAGLVVERLLLGTPIQAGAFGVYAVCGGVAAASTRSLAELWKSGYGARAACLATLSAMACLHLAYFANVKLLPAEPYWTPLSLSADLVLVGLVLGVASWLLRSPRAQALRIRFGRVAAAGGLLTLALGLGAVALEWPRSAVPISRRGDGPNLLLVVLDSARRDHLGLYGYGRPTSPEIDRWSTRARVFTEAFSASSWTVPSVATLMQSKGPGGPVARRLAALGYASACFTDNPHLHAQSRLLAGFDHVQRSVGTWRALLRGTVLGETIERIDSGDDERLVASALRWATAQKSPVFLYVHLMDSHTPYRRSPIDGRKRGGRHVEFPSTGMALSAEEAEDIAARYDGGIRSSDRAAAALLEAVGGWGRPWLAIVTADHGESLGEDGRWFHGGSLAPELLGVPLLVEGTTVAPGRVDGVVGQSAVPATLLAAAGLEPEPGAFDLRRVERPGVAEGGLPPRLLYRVAGDYKLVFDADERRARLFNRRLDPSERRDLAALEPQRTAALLAEVPGHEPKAVVAIPPEEVERLKALGYVVATPEHSGSR